MMLFPIVLFAEELECAVLTSPLANSNDSPTTTSIQWTSQPEAIGYEVTVGTSQFENDILEQTIYTENFTEELNLPPNTTIYVIIIPFSNTQFAVGCEFLMFTTSDCNYFINPVSEVPLCYSRDAENELRIDVESVKAALVGQQENLKISYFGIDGTFVDLETLQPTAENNQFPILAKVEDELNCVKEVEFILSFFELPEADSFENVVVCKNFALPELNQGYVYYSENKELLSVGTILTKNQTIFVSPENIACAEEKSFVVRIDPNLCNTLEVGTDYPSYFTPNGDGINDFWTLSKSLDIVVSSILIHDRYGNLISQFSMNDVGWNGMNQGEPLPASDYWFMLITENKPIYGHFSLKR